VMRAVDAAVCSAAGATFNAIQFFNKRNPNPSFTPKWSDKPLLKSWEKTKPTLGWPRQTDSLCPDCVKEAREAIIHGKKDWRDLMNEKVGEIKAQIVERDGEVWMIKDCPIHGHYEDMMAIDAKFLDHIEKQFPGRDIPAHNDEDLHKHGSSTVRYGPRLRSHCRPNQSLQHDVRSLLHGRQPGWLRSRTRLGRNSGNS